MEAKKNFIGIVEGEQRTADQSPSNLRLNEIGVPELFHPCSRSICQASELIFIPVTITRVLEIFKVSDNGLLIF